MSFDNHTTSQNTVKTTMGAPIMTSTAPLSIATKRVKLAMDIGSANQSEQRANLSDTVAFSPVTDKGCFEFDRILKSADILKKSRRTKTYKPFYIVLRPLHLSLYSDKEHTALRHSIPLSEITAVARRRRTKRPRPGLFSVFTPERNFHFDARSNTVADSWVDQLRVSARIDQWDSGVGSSEEEGDTADDTVVTSSATKAIPIIRPRDAANHNVSTSYGASVGSFSSISSFGAANFPGSSISLAVPMSSSPEHLSLPTRPVPHRTASAVEVEQERVLRNGRLVLLKSKGGVRKWKPVWAVLRVKSLAIYPNEDVITEERNWRFCAKDDDDLAAWLGTIKSLVAKRRAASGGATLASEPQQPS